jgi:hypothetical protein
MSNRSEQLADEFKERKRLEETERREKLEDEKIKNQKVILDASTVKRTAPGMWDKFRAEFEKQCVEFNESFGETTLGVRRQNASQILVSAGENSSLRVSFGENDHKIRFGGLFSPT